MKHLWKDISKASCIVVFGLATNGCTHNSSAAPRTSVEPKETHAIEALEGIKLTVRNDDTLDYEATSLAISCSAHQYMVNLRQPFLDTVAALAPPSPTSHTTHHVELVIDGIDTRVRCYLKSTFAGECVAKTSLRSHIVTGPNLPSPNTERIDIVVENAEISHFCKRPAELITANNNALLSEYSDELVRKVGMFREVN